jgi:hypothetical protein
MGKSDSKPSYARKSEWSYHAVVPDLLRCRRDFLAAGDCTLHKRALGRLYLPCAESQFVDDRSSLVSADECTALTAILSLFRRHLAGRIGSFGDNVLKITIAPGRRSFEDA